MAYILIPRRMTEKEPMSQEQPAVKTAWEKPADWAFMEQSGKVLSDLPETWRAYAKTFEGRMGIIDMEYRELKEARGKEDVSRELVHLGSACLHLWRLLNVE